jgi:hypothetical protein
MLESAIALERPTPKVDVWLRFEIAKRRLRFAALVSRLTGLPLEQAWRAFRPLSKSESGLESATSLISPPMNW